MIDPRSRSRCSPDPAAADRVPAACRRLRSAVRGHRLVPGVGELPIGLQGRAAGGGHGRRTGEAAEREVGQVGGAGDRDGDDPAGPEVSRCRRSVLIAGAGHPGVGQGPGRRLLGPGRPPAPRCRCSDAARAAAAAACSTSCLPCAYRPSPTTSSSSTMTIGARTTSSVVIDPRSRSAAGPQAPRRRRDRAWLMVRPRRTLSTRSGGLLLDRRSRRTGSPSARRRAR